MRLSELANPSRFNALAERVLPWLVVATALAFALGLYQALFVAPDDYQQGATVKIMFIHVPSAWLGMLGWGLMSIAALGTLVWRHPLADVAMKAAAPIGAAFTLICLVTGSLWGRPMWGTYWAWDPRLISELILLFLYVAVMSLRGGFEDAQRADRASGLLAVVGVVNVPIIHFSVQWWNSLHQGPTIAKLGRPAMPGSMLWPLLSMLLGFMLFYGAVLCLRLRGEVLNRERQSTWVREAIG